MTQSSLATKRMISPNTSGYRGAPSKITVHHTAGVISADGLGQIFANPARQASCNYGVGNDGEIICILEEEYWPWTSSSGWNDSQAVTLEVSNSYAGGDWPIGDAAWRATVALLADICTRWGIWPEYDQTIYATYTEHRMFAATGCPGDFIHARMTQLIAEVRAAMNDSQGAWHEDDRGWWYEYPNGDYAVNKWEYINDKWYYFDETGYMVSGWVYWADQWYYCKTQEAQETDYGYMLTGWQDIVWRGKECRFYFDPTGAMFPGGFHEIKGRWYAFDSNGVLVKDDKAVVVGSKTGRITIKDVA